MFLITFAATQEFIKATWISIQIITFVRIQYSCQSNFTVYTDWNNKLHCYSNMWELHPMCVDCRESSTQSRPRPRHTLRQNEDSLRCQYANTPPASLLCTLQLKPTLYKHYVIKSATCGPRMSSRLSVYLLLVISIYIYIYINELLFSLVSLKVENGWTDLANFKMLVEVQGRFKRW